MGDQLLTVSIDSNVQEIISYFKIISWPELILFFILLISAIGGIVTKGKHFRWKYSNKYNWLVWTLLLCLALRGGYAYNFIKQYRNYTKEQIAEKELIHQKNNFVFGAKSSENSAQNVILLIGESHRYDYFKKYWFQYPQPDDLLFFNDMISQYGFTLRAMPQILSRKTIEDNTILYHEPSLFKLYEEAGYETHFISYLPKLWKGDDSINFIALDSQHYHRYGNIHKNDKVNDADILPILEDILHTQPEKKKFIVIKMIGVHYNFEDRYPKEYDLIQPSLLTQKAAVSAENKSIVSQTYENAMNYSVFVIQKIFQQIADEPSSSLILFVSDHGINLFDNGYWNVANVKAAFHIPFLIYANKAFMKSLAADHYISLKKHLDSPLTVGYIFETIGSLSAISRYKHHQENDLTLQSILPKQRWVVHSDHKKYIYEQMPI